MPGEFLSDDEVFGGDTTAGQSTQFMSDEEVFGSSSPVTAPQTPATTQAVQQSGGLLRSAVATLQAINTAARTPSPAWMRPAEKFITEQPLLSKEFQPLYWYGRGLEKAASFLPESLQTPAKITAGLYTGGGEALSSFTTPANLGFAAVGGTVAGALGKVIDLGVAGAFTGQAIQHTPEMWGQLKAAYNAGDAKRTTELAVAMGLSYLPGLAFLHGGKGGTPAEYVPTPKVEGGPRYRSTVTPEGGERGAEQQGNAQVQTPPVTLGEQEGTGGAVAPAGSGDNVVRTPQGEGARREVSPPQKVTLSEDIEDALKSAEAKAAAGDHAGAAKDLNYVYDFMPDDAAQAEAAKARMLAIEKQAPAPVEEAPPIEETPPVTQEPPKEEPVAPVEEKPEPQPGKITPGQIVSEGGKDFQVTLVQSNGKIFGRVFKDGKASGSARRLRETEKAATEEVRPAASPAKGEAPAPPVEEPTPPTEQPVAPAEGDLVGKGIRMDGVSYVVRSMNDDMVFLEGSGDMARIVRRRPGESVQEFHDRIRSGGAAEAPRLPAREGAPAETEPVKPITEQGWTVKALDKDTVFLEGPGEMARIVRRHPQETTEQFRQRLRKEGITPPEGDLKAAKVPEGWTLIEGDEGKTKLNPVRSLPDAAHKLLQPVKQDTAFSKIIQRVLRHYPGRGGIREVTPGGTRTFPRHLLPKDLSFVEALAEKMGVPYHWFETDHPRFKNVDGFYDSGRLFLNKDMKARAPEFIFTHEFSHYLEKNHPELYNKLAQALLDSGFRTKGMDRFKARLSTARYDLDKNLVHELIAEFGAEALKDPTRMDRLMGKHVGMLDRVVTLWRDFVERIGRALGLRHDIIPTASGAVKGLASAREAFLKVFQEAQGREPLTGEASEGPRFSERPRDPRTFITSGAEKVGQGFREIGPWLREMVKEHGKEFRNEDYRSIFEQSRQGGPVEVSRAPDTPEGKEKLTSTKNAVTDRERIARGLTPIAHGATMASAEHMMEADAILANDPWAGRKLVDDLASGRKNTISGTEEAILLREKMEAQLRMVDAARVHDAVTGPDRENAGRTFDEETAYANRIDKATSLTGSYWSEFGLFRQRMWKDDYSGANLRRRVQRAKGDEPITPGEVLEADKRATTLENKRQAMEKKRNDLMAQDVKDRQKRGLGVLEKAEAEARKRIAQKGKGPQMAEFSQTAMAFEDESIIGAAHIGRGIKDFDDFRSVMLGEFGPVIDSHMQDIYRQAREIERNSRQRSPAERLAQRKGLYREKIAEEKRKRAAGEMGPPPRQPVPMDDELLRLITDYEKEKRLTNEWIYGKRLEQRTRGQKTADIIKEIWALPRGAKSSFDLSGIGRQGGLVLRAHPGRTLSLKGGDAPLKSMFRAMKSRDAFESEMVKMQQDPAYQIYDKVVEFSDISQDLTKNEEAYRSVWADKIPGIAHSQYAYVYWLNRLRFDSMKSLEADLTKTGKATPEELQALGRFVNMMTGKGDIGGWHKLNTVFWAPQYAVSRFQFLLEPARLALGAARIGKYAELPRVRKAMAKEYARVLRGYGVEYGLIAGAIAAGIIPATISTDPRSADFLKIRFGETRLDPMAGLSQATVLMSRLLTGKITTQGGEVRSLYKPTAGYGKKIWGTVITDFLRGKMAPWPAFIWNYEEGQDVTGQIKDIRDLFGMGPHGALGPVVVGYDLLGSLSGSDIYEAMKSNGVPAGAALGLAGMLGWGLQTYSQRLPARQPSPRPRPRRPAISARGLPPGTATVPTSNETQGTTYNVIK